MTTYDCLNLLVGNHYVPPDTNPKAITEDFCFLENQLDTQHFRVILIFS
jgi:hypothetical protein